MKRSYNESGLSLQLGVVLGKFDLWKLYTLRAVVSEHQKCHGCDHCSQQANHSKDQHRRQ